MQYSVVGMGFVGTALAEQLRAVRTYTRASQPANRDEHDVLVFSAASSSRLKANAAPDADVDDLNAAMGSVRGARCNRCVLISTIDVYGEGEGKHEGDVRRPSSAYGVNRAWLEDAMLKEFGDRLSVFRLPSLFGPGLRKNVLFDVLSGNQLEVNLADEHQWYDTAWLGWHISVGLIKPKAETNLFTPPITNAEMVGLLPSFARKTFYKDPVTARRYDHRTRSNTSGYVEVREVVKSRISQFASQWSQ